MSKKKKRQDRIRGRSAHIVIDDIIDQSKMTPEARASILEFGKKIGAVPQSVLVTSPERVPFDLVVGLDFGSRPDRTSLVILKSREHQGPELVFDPIELPGRG